MGRHPGGLVSETEAQIHVEMSQGWPHVHDYQPANVQNQDSRIYADDPSFVPTMGLRGSDTKIWWNGEIRLQVWLTTLKTG